MLIRHPLLTQRQPKLALLLLFAQFEQLAAPALIIVGEVVGLHENLAWFGEKVLYNHGLVLPEEAGEEVSRVC